MTMEEMRAAHRVPAWCPICERVMRSSKSTTMYFRYGCCVDCFINFVEDREEKWKSGWRPDEIQVKKVYDKIET